MILFRSKCSSVDVVVRFRSDTYTARAGTGEAATLASSTNSALIAAEKAAGKFLGHDCPIELVLRQSGSCCEGMPWLYRATRKGGAA